MAAARAAPLPTRLGRTVREPELGLGQARHSPCRLHPPRVMGDRGRERAAGKGKSFCLKTGASRPRSCIPVRGKPHPELLPALPLRARRGLRVRWQTQRHCQNCQKPPSPCTAIIKLPPCPRCWRVAASSRAAPVPSRLCWAGAGLQTPARAGLAPAGSGSGCRWLTAARNPHLWQGDTRTWYPEVARRQTLFNR